MPFRLHELGWIAFFLVAMAAWLEQIKCRHEMHANDENSISHEGAIGTLEEKSHIYEALNFDIHTPR